LYSDISLTVDHSDKAQKNTSPSFQRSCRTAVPCKAAGTSKSASSPRAFGTSWRSQQSHSLMIPEQSQEPNFECTHRSWIRGGCLAMAGGLPLRSEALRRAVEEEERDETRWSSAPKALAADAMAGWRPQERSTRAAAVRRIAASACCGRSETGSDGD
jgi:hypothetical protein